MATCFVIMPISTPDRSLSDYKGEGDYFYLVLEHLVRPDLKLLNLRLSRLPRQSLTTLKKAEIIPKLEMLDLVNCDMSTVNPNVCLDLGIRTAQTSWCVWPGMR
mgnify:CR=1 FL=1